MKGKRSNWRPKPAVLESVKVYFLGFLHHQKEIYPKRSTIAKRLGIKVRTLDRYLHHLVETKWMETTKRTPRTAFRTVMGSAFGGPVGGSVGGPIGGSIGGSQEIENQEGNPSKENREGKTPKQHHQRDDVACAREEQEILELAGVRKSAANLKVLRDIVSAGFTDEQIRGGVALGRLRHMRNPAACAIASFRFYVNPIAEAREAYGPEHLKQTIDKLNRELSRQTNGCAETGGRSSGEEVGLQGNSTCHS